jgi:hypothetical protein
MTGGRISRIAKRAKIGFFHLERHSKSSVGGRNPDEMGVSAPTRGSSPRCKMQSRSSCSYFSKCRKEDSVLNAAYRGNRNPSP